MAKEWVDFFLFTLCISTAGQHSHGPTSPTHLQLLQVHRSHVEPFTLEQLLTRSQKDDVGAVGRRQVVVVKKNGSQSLHSYRFLVCATRTAETNSSSDTSSASSVQREQRVVESSGGWALVILHDFSRKNSALLFGWVTASRPGPARPTPTSTSQSRTTARTKFNRVYCALTPPTTKIIDIFSCVDCMHLKLT